MLSPGQFDGERAWHEAVMNSLLQITGAYKSAIRLPEPRGSRMTPLGFEESAIEEYKAYYHRFDFGRALGAQPQLGFVFSRNEFYGEELPRFRRTEYYADYIAKYRVFDALCLSSRSEDHARGAVLYLWYERDQDERQRRMALGLLELLAPSFRSGVQLSSHLHRCRTDLLAMFDALPDGCAFYNADGALLHQNPSLSRMIASCADATGLRHAIAARVLATRNLHSSPKGEESIASQGVKFLGVARYVISASRLEAGVCDTRALILVTVKCPNTYAATPDKLAHLKKTLGLTSREAEVANLLTSRCTNREIAAKLGMSGHTARHHTESVLRKLGVSSRAEVLAAINREYDSQSERGGSLNV